MIYIVRSLNRALKRPDINRITRKNNRNKRSKNKKKLIYSKTQYLKLKAHKNHIKSKKSLTKQIYFFLTKSTRDFNLTGLGKKLAIKRMNEAFKNPSRFSKQITSNVKTIIF